MSSKRKFVETEASSEAAELPVFEKPVDVPVPESSAVSDRPVSKKIEPRPSLLCQGMMMTAFVLCPRCLTASRAEKLQDRGDGHVAVSIVMCEKCVNTNTRFRWMQKDLVFGPRF